MEIKDLKDRKPVDEITLKITEKEETRELRDGQLKVCNCTGEDDTGKVSVTLWNADIDKVKKGDTIKITKGWSQNYNGNMQISSGKMGTLEVVE